MATIADPGIQVVLDNIETVVASEGGTLETAELRDSEAVPPTVPRFYRELREVLDRDAIVL